MYVTSSMFYIKEDKKQQSNKCCQLEISAMGKNLHILRSLLDIGHSSNTDFMRRKFKLPLAVNQDYAHFNFRIDTLAHITHVSVRFLLGRNKQEKFVQYIAYSYSRICNLQEKKITAQGTSRVHSQSVCAEKLLCFCDPPTH